MADRHGTCRQKKQGQRRCWDVWATVGQRTCQPCASIGSSLRRSSMQKIRSPSTPSQKSWSHCSVMRAKKRSPQTDRRHSPSESFLRMPHPSDCLLPMQGPRYDHKPHRAFRPVWVRDELCRMKHVGAHLPLLCFALASQTHVDQVGDRHETSLQSPDTITP